GAGLRLYLSALHQSIEIMLLGLDIGSSSVKAALVDDRSGKTIAMAMAPATEMKIDSPFPGWAEQDPVSWWNYTVEAIQQLKSNHSAVVASVKAIGISYQMHGLVAVDENNLPVRPSIIWCDSRAVKTGAQADKALGHEWCLEHLLNSPGNFTASKLAWVKENEPHIFSRIKKIMLPGDYIALRLTAELCTTDTGLSEGVFWDFIEGKPSQKLLSHYGFDSDLLAPVSPVFSIQGKVTAEVSQLTGIPAGTPVSYRAGDQPNNAFSLNVLHPGETAATAGTSGVIYSITERNVSDPQSRVNTFLHVSHTSDLQRNGVLLCINGTGILNSWLRRTLGGLSYEDMNQLAGGVPVGSDGLQFYPFGNGAERVLGNKNPGASMLNLDLNRHGQAHLLRAAQEGIVFSMFYGFEVLRQMGVETTVVRAGRANMFLSPLFREAFVNTLQVPLELYDTNGAVGAAIGAGVGAGIFESFPDAFRGLHLLHTEEPDPKIIPEYRDAARNWNARLSF
ncbi:MAG: xylulokinase, partial [Cyclobacteriaceae bacterium]